MMLRRKILVLLFLIAGFFANQTTIHAQEHNILFCGEAIPVNNNFVATKLMNIIRKQIPNVNLPSLHQRALAYFPYIENFLRKYNLPQDFKYLPIVESGFTLETSRPGARGFWQIMPETASDYGLVMTSTYDDRDDFEKSTAAACRILVDYYNNIKKTMNVSSWVLTAAAYNFGIGNIFKAIKSQGSDYFTMNLNPETATYVYKIIAIKELFEFPELYMKGFGYNVFSSTAIAPEQTGITKIDTTIFTQMSLNTAVPESEKKANEVFVGAHIKGKYKNFRDGDIIKIELGEDLSVQGGFTRKGTLVQGAGWIIDGRIYVDLGYGHDVLIYDAQFQRGIDISNLKDNVPILLKNSIHNDNSGWN